MPLQYLLWFYYLCVGLIGLYFLINLYHVFRYGRFTFVTTITTIIFIIGFLLTLAVSTSYLSPVDWSIDVFGENSFNNRPVNTQF